MLIDLLNAIPEGCRERVYHNLGTGEVVSKGMCGTDLLCLERLGIILYRDGYWYLRSPMGYLLRKYYLQMVELLDDPA